LRSVVVSTFPLPMKSMPIKKSRPGLPARSSKKTWVLRCLLAVASAVACFAYADGNENVAGLLCADLSPPAQATFVDFVNGDSHKEADGSLKVLGEVRQGGLCVRNVTLVGSFGVVMVNGESCSDDEQRFVEAVGVAIKASVAGRAVPNAIATFDIPNPRRRPGTLVIYRGEPSFQPSLSTAGSAGSSPLAFMCVRQDGGTQ
jgi:hypothetical protein